MSNPPKTTWTKVAFIGGLAAAIIGSGYLHTHHHRSASTTQSPRSSTDAATVPSATPTAAVDRASHRSTPSPRRDATPASTTSSRQAAHTPAPARRTTPAKPAPPAAVTVAAPSRASSATPTLAARAGISAWESSDTSIDASPGATENRASQWLTAALRTNLRRYPPATPPGSQWSTWARHRAWLRITTALADDDPPADTATAAVRQVAVTVTPIGRDGWRGPAQTHVDVVVLHRTAIGWRIANVNEEA